MSQEFPNLVHCFGSVDDAGALVSGAGFVPAQTGAGLYTLTLDQPIASTAAAVLVSGRGTVPQEFSVVHTSTTVKTIHAFDTTGVASNAAFDFLILRGPG